MSTEIQTTTPARGGGLMSIVPRNITEALEIARVLAKSSMVPTCYRGKPDDIFAAMEMGSRLGFGPMQSVQNIAPINGRPSVFGDGLMAVIRAFPDFVSMDEDNAEKALSQGFGRCKLSRRRRDGTVETVEQIVTIEAAKRAGWWGKQGPWSATPGRMLQMRTRGWAARDLFADRLCGVSFAEESMDCPIVIESEVVSDMPQPKVAEAAPAATPAPAAPIGPPIAGEVLVTVEGVDTKTGTKPNGQEWTRFGIKVRHADGATDIVGTFSSTLGEEAQRLIGKPAYTAVKSRTQGDKTYLDLEAIRPAPEAVRASDDVPF